MLMGDTTAQKVERRTSDWLWFKVAHTLVPSTKRYNLVLVTCSDAQKLKDFSRMISYRLKA